MMRSVFLLTALLLLAPEAASQTAGGIPWNTTKWAVACRQAAVDSLRTEASTQCDDESPVSGAAVNRYELEQASTWLREQGFHAPYVLQQDLPGRGMSYLAFVDPSALSENVLAIYRPSEAGIYLNTTSFIAVGRGGTEEAAERRLALERSEQQSPVHELFHGIQFQYTHDIAVPWSRAEYVTTERDWIWEGTAQAIDMEWAKRTSGGAPVGGYLFHLDNSIFKPDTDRNDQYRVARLWLFAGHYLLSSPERLSYLHEMFLHDLGPASGVAGVDAHFRHMNAQVREGRDGLADVLTAYVADKGDSKGHYSETTDVTLAAGTRPATERVQRRVRPLAADPVAVSLNVSPGVNEGVGLSVRIEGAERPADLHLVVGTERYDIDDPMAPEAERNVYRGAYGPGKHDLFVRVVNAASDAQATAQQSYSLVIDAVPLAPCSNEQMQASLSDLMRYPGTLRADVYDLEKEYRPGAGTMRFSGLANGGGRACGFNLAEVSLAGQAISGDLSLEGVEATAMERMEQMQQMMANLPPRLRRALESGEEPENMTRAEREAMRAFAGNVMGMTAATTSDDARAVLHLFSPHVFTWQTAILGMPFQTGHNGVGGWPVNSAAQVVLEFETATPEALRVGKTYAVSAYAPGPDAEGLPPQVPTMGGFFSSWEGQFQTIPPQTSEERRRIAADRAECEAKTAAMVARLDGVLEASGGMVNQAALVTQCDGMGTAFEGESRIVTGTLSGTVTITRLTGTTVEGTFDLSGTGTLHKTTSRFTYSESTGMLDGSESEETTEPGGFSLSGTFLAPASIEGIERPFGYRTVSLSSR